MQKQVVAYDPAWRRSFEAEAKHIERALGDIVVHLHHIGSTAISGIFAKPIIDFLLEVDDIGQLDHRTSAMEELGYEANGGVWYSRAPVFQQGQCCRYHDASSTRVRS